MRRLAAPRVRGYSVNHRRLAAVESKQPVGAHYDEDQFRRTVGKIKDSDITMSSSNSLENFTDAHCTDRTPDYEEPAWDYEKPFTDHFPAGGHEPPQGPAETESTPTRAPGSR